MIGLVGAIAERAQKLGDLLARVAGVVGTGVVGPHSLAHLQKVELDADQILDRQGLGARLRPHGGKRKAGDDQQACHIRLHADASLTLRGSRPEAAQDRERADPDPPDEPCSGRAAKSSFVISPMNKYKVSGARG
jgi:hypothetical protein